MSEAALTKQRIISELTKSPHGKLDEYLQVGVVAASQEPEFFAHLIAWNAQKGQVRDSQVALPIVSLRTWSVPEGDALLENSYAHLAKLGPREFLRAYQFARQTKLPGRMRKLKNLVTLYLQQIEGEAHWQRIALQHRRTRRYRQAA
jgi:hypothetical protein